MLISLQNSIGSQKMVLVSYKACHFRIRMSARLQNFTKHAVQKHDRITKDRTDFLMACHFRTGLGARQFSLRSVSNSQLLSLLRTAIVPGDPLLLTTLDSNSHCSV